MSVDKLAHINLVGKVCAELERAIQINDKDLAEFLIHLAREAKDLAGFQKSLQENEAEFEQPVIETIYSLVCAHTPSKRGSALADPNAPQLSGLKGLDVEDYRAHHAHKEEARAFPALALPDGVRSRDFEAKDRPMSNVLAVYEKEEQREHTAPSHHHDRHAPPAPTTGAQPYMNPDRMKYISERDDREGRDRDYNRDRDYGSSRYSEPSSFRMIDPTTSTPQPYTVYSATVTRISENMAWVSLSGFPEEWEGILDRSAITYDNARVNIREKLREKQSVFVKVLSIVGRKVTVSMRDVDQTTGKDLRPTTRGQGQSSLTGISSTGSSGRDRRDDSGRPMHRVSSRERWERQQLLNSGVQGNVMDVTLQGDLEEAQEDVDIEITEAEPAFLKGQTRMGLESAVSDAVRVVRMPEGSLHRAALTQAALTKERREVREQQKQQMQDSVPMDISKGWEDPLATTVDRRLAGELRSVGAGAAVKQAVPEWKQAMLGGAVTYGKVTSLSIKEQRESLPIFALRRQLLDAVAANQVLVVIGETGSGKTTQMMQYLAEEGYTAGGKVIACTQPRRVAATSVAKRVAEEVGCSLGAEVGYSIRFEDCTSSETVLKYMTDGMLLRELLVNPDLSRYSVIMLDEAHERTINTDVLFGLLKAAMKRRKDLKLIVTSATLDAEKFSAYFGNCPIFSIPGRLYPVTVLYAQQPEPDYLEAALLTVMQIHLTQPPGDILLFLTGKEEIDTACEILFERCKQLGKRVPPLDVLPVYSALPSEIQSKIFDPAPRGTRKCVVATNIAEASLTIDGIYYVVDPGFCKLKVYDPKLGMDTLQVTPISQASANQRAGRAGRTGPGKCYRLYTEQAFRTELLPSTVPEIQRTNLGNTVLMLKAMGINDLLGFDFMDPPPANTLVMALQQLYTLGALDEEGLLTRMGRRMAELPLEPMLSKVLMTSIDMGCSDEICSIVAMLSVDEVFYRPKDKQAQADSKRAQFFRPEGDHLTLLAVYDGWVKSGESNAWCQERYVTARTMRKAAEVRKQLVTIVERQGFKLQSCGKNIKKVCMCIAAGYFSQAAKKNGQEGYQTLLEQQQVFVHPSSSLFNKQPEWLLYHKLVLTSKEYMHECMVVDPRWLTELAPQMFQKCDATTMSRRKKKERLQPLFDRYNAPDAWRLSKRKG